MLTLGLVLSVLVSHTFCQLEIVNQWNLFQFDVPFGYPTNPNYTTAATVFNGLEIGWDKIYLSFPRFMPGAPLSFGFIPRVKPGRPGDLSPVIQPYPSWDWHRDAAAGQPEANNCSGLVSVLRARADRCNRLWVLDSGVVDSLVNFRVACPPKLLVFDMRTDELDAYFFQFWNTFRVLILCTPIFNNLGFVPPRWLKVRSVTFPSDVLRPNSLLSGLVLDDQNDDGSGAFGDCENIFVYLSDTTNPGLIVYDARRDSAWRIGNPAMFPDPDFGTYTVAGEYFTLMDGIIGLALSPPGPERILYFQPFASNRLFSVPTSVLKAGPNPGDDSELPVSLVGHKSSQAAPLAVDYRDGSLLFSPISETAIAAWTPGSSNHRVLAYDPERLQFVLDIRPADRDNGIIWILSTRLQKFLRRTVSGKEVNLRIMRVIQPTDFYSHAKNSLFPIYKK